eukprot:3444296-Pleurochrysis_carterae.AAC.1
MEHAGMFLAYLEAAERPWAAPEHDDDDYRKERAVEFFNLGVSAALIDASIWGASIRHLHADLQNLCPTLSDV